MMSYQFYVPTRTLFGAGMLNELHNQTMPGKKAMVVISNGKFMKTTGILERVLKELLAAGVETAVFDKVQANHFVRLSWKVQRLQEKIAAISWLHWAVEASWTLPRQWRLWSPIP